MSLFHPNSPDAPHLHRLMPPAAMPGGEVELQELISIRLKDVFLMRVLETPSLPSS